MIVSSIKVELNCNKEKLWDIITNNKNCFWRSDLLKTEIIDETHFIEYTKKNYPTYFTITSKKKLKEYKFTLKNTNIEGKWSGIFTKLKNGNIELIFTEEINVSNFIMKLFAKSYLKKQQKNYINDLKKELIKE